MVVLTSNMSSSFKHFNDTVRTYLGAHTARDACFRMGVHYIPVALFIDFPSDLQDLLRTYAYA